MTPEKKTLNEIWKAQRDTAIAITDLTKAIKDRPINLSIPGMMELKVPDTIVVEDLSQEVLLALNQAEITAKGEVSVKNALDIKNFPELQKIVGSVEAEIKEPEQLAIAIATQLAKVLPMPKDYPKEIDIKKVGGKVEVFGKTLTKIDNNTVGTPLYVQLVNGKKTVDIEQLLKDVATASGRRVISPGGSADGGGGGGGGGGGAVTIAGGGFVDFGAKADAPADDDSGTFSFMAFVKRIAGNITSILGKTTDIETVATAINTAQIDGSQHVQVDNQVSVAPVGLTNEALELINPATEDAQNDTIDVLEEIQSAIQGIAQARGIAGDLRVTILGGAVTITSGTITTVTTVGTLSNITAIGGLNATPFLQGQGNMAAIQSNINNVVVS